MVRDLGVHTCGSGGMERQIKKLCWAIKTQRGFMKEIVDPCSPLQTALFKSRKHAQSFIEDNPYWIRLKAEVVRVKVTVTEML